MMSPAEILAFWRAAGREKWFSADPEFDEEVRTHLLSAHLDAVTRGAGDTVLTEYEATPEGTLALILLLDQVPRNVFRGTPRAFATDAAALKVSERALAAGADKEIAEDLRGFLYLPYMHAEDPEKQALCVRLYENLGDPDQLHYARIHRDIIIRFGRFPHRNPILGRHMLEEEAEYLAQGGFSA